MILSHLAAKRNYGIYDKEVLAIVSTYNLLVLEVVGPKNKLWPLRQRGIGHCLYIQGIKTPLGLNIRSQSTTIRITSSTSCHQNLKLYKNSPSSLTWTLWSLINWDKFKGKSMPMLCLSEFILEEMRSRGLQQTAQPKLDQLKFLKVRYHMPSCTSFPSRVREATRKDSFVPMILPKLRSPKLLLAILHEYYD